MAKRKIKINLPGLLRMLGENIYAEPDVAVREMIQNAHDTSIIRTTRDPSFTNPSIQVTFDRQQQTLTFADNGAGMTEDELHKNLSTVGESFTRIQKDELRGANAQEAALLIGQFGIGLLSAFSISKRVEVFTRSYQDGQTGFSWSCDGDIHYSTEPIDKPEIGTRVMLHLRDSKLELLDEKRLREAIKKYADFLSVPILLQGKQVNACTPPWETEEGQADLHEYVQSRWGLFPLGLIPFNTADFQIEDDEPLPKVSGLLFVPMIPFELSRDFGEIDVYISRMFIKADDKDLLPRWARFVKGVINTSELTPTLNRNEIIPDDTYRRVQGLLGDIIIDYIRMLKEQDVEKLKLLVGAYNNTIKARALEDDAFFVAICDLVRVSTDQGDVTIQEYLEKSGNVIYYFAERGSSTQHKVLFSHKGLPVIDASWGMEEEFLEAYAERKGVQIERLAAGSGVIFDVPETTEEKWGTLELAFKRRIGKEARAVEFEPESVPAVLVARPLEKEDKELANAQMGISSDAIRQMFQNMTKSKILRASESDTILHLNIKNPLINQLRDMPRTETFALALTCIYHNASLFAQHYVSADNAVLMFEANNRAISAMITNAQALAEQQESFAKVELERDEMKRRIGELRDRIGDVALSPHKSCFFAYHYDVQFHAVKDEVQRVLGQNYGVEVVAASTHVEDADAVRNIETQIAKAHFGIADITGNNPNVMWELGLMGGLRKPVIILKDQSDTAGAPFDVYSKIRVEYQVVTDKAKGRREFALLASGLADGMKLIDIQCPGLAIAKAWEG